MPDIMIDAGHGGSDPGAVGPTGLKEKEVTLKLALKAAEMISGQGITVALTRTTDVFIGLSDRSAIANSSNAKYFLSIHINSAGTPKANGTETYALAAGGQGERLARSVQQSLVQSIGLTDRGVKFANYSVLRETKMPAALVELCFINNPDEEALLRNEAFLDKAALGIAKGVAAFLGISWKDGGDQKDLTPIMGASQLHTSQMISYAVKGNASPKLPNCSLEELAGLFAEEAGIEGVRADVAWAQSLKETGYFKYGGVVLPEQNNYGGIGALSGNPEGQAASFDIPRTGVRAQIQHLKAYASTEALKQEVVDPRFGLVKRGSARYVEWLGYEDNPNGAGWAYPGKGYGADIVNILKAMSNEPVTPGTSENSSIPAWQREGFEKLIARNIIQTPGYWRDKMDQPITVGEVMGILGKMVD
ncbi:N-acetylmuramoyl-L-alanine amidase [Anaerobacterium chartisolvens]|uniref:N-acetylmuramoyl-L-alanine amidase n=1 Tax=Anaerobacterium chartisolvens TaxID=1297424 RepID=A0A369AW25_9FIRM|nr:N-acetylmuramoyl-L-alanine amidase [Anaerobacterium chartisolvens]RCX13275.1 N-acetylmuramoyl-L-alanine amidase [Anaerobacterium chartisolvens]